MTELLQRVEENIRNRHLLKRGQTILVAVSGGLDSMVLLQALHGLSQKHHWKLTVAHFNHQLRGRSSNADEQLVHESAVDLKLPFNTECADVRKFAKKSKLSIEMAARKLRHEFFARVARELNISVVALAHHADDQIELFFLRLLRGAGGEGLAGMKWRSASPVDKKVTLIRPMLNTTKTELREFARKNKIRFREDGTNVCLDLPRNRVRHELLPLLRRRYQRALNGVILRLMEIVGAEAEVIAGMARQWLEESGRLDLPGRALTTDHGVFVFTRLPVAVQRRVLQLQLAQLGVLSDFELIERLRRSPEVFVTVGPGFSVARNTGGHVRLQTRSPVQFQDDELAVHLADRAGEVDFGRVHLLWKFEGVKKAVRFGKTNGHEYFDADRVGRRIILRYWRPGDRFQPIGLRSAAKLQDLFTNQKIPRGQRRNLVVAESANGGIFWVQDLRMSEIFKLTSATKRRLVWCWQSRSD